jgi:hypothetical protein
MTALGFKRHRCFKIPREKLDLFLIALDVNFSDSIIKHQMEYVFISKDDAFYDVVVAQRGSYPYLENHLAEFAQVLKGPSDV